MIRLVLDADTAAKFQNVSERVELCDANGRILGFYQPANGYEALTEEDRRGPFSNEELELRRKEPGGKPLSEILKRLEEL